MRTFSFRLILVFPTNLHQYGRVKMSTKEPVKQPEPDVEDDDEPDEWYTPHF